jgi:hypothetical protein
MLPVAVPAQSVVTSFLDKHGKDDNIQLISIGKKMFEQMEKQSLGSSELRETIKGLDNIQIITSEDSLLSNEYYLSALAIFSETDSYADLFSIDGEEQQLIVKLKESKGLITELIILSYNSDGFNLISMTGKNIDLGTLAKYSIALDFKALKKLRNLEDKN